MTPRTPATPLQKKNNRQGCDETRGEFQERLSFQFASRFGEEWGFDGGPSDQKQDGFELLGVSFEEHMRFLNKILGRNSGPVEAKGGLQTVQDRSFLER